MKADFRFDPALVEKAIALARVLQERAGELQTPSERRQQAELDRMLQTPADQIADDLPLFGPGGLGLDSIDALELVVSMEKTFGVGVPNSEVAGKALQTVNSIHDYIVEKTERPAA